VIHLLGADACVAYSCSKVQTVAESVLERLLDPMGSERKIASFSSPAENVRCSSNEPQSLFVVPLA
jgi:hypothetical protein